jgi:Ca2+-binding RTX toxin-like protein
LGNNLLRGGAGHDNLLGGSNNDKLYGDADDDILNGDAGQDILDGGPGNDLLIGRAGRDFLTGGAGADRFDFNAISESQPGNNNRDQIKDFNRTQGDKIDLGGIDANSKASGNQAFKFIGGQAFNKVAGELRYKDGLVQGDVNGDGKADFEIAVNTSSLIQNDFLL